MQDEPNPVELLATLKAIRVDPSRVVTLYQELYRASFFAWVQAAFVDNVESFRFLTYVSLDKVRELPLFTRREYLPDQMPREAVLVLIEGAVLWNRLLQIVETGKCEAAVDPGQEHGIRVSREMILAMNSSYSSPSP